MPILRYNDDEWEHVLVKDPAWSRPETDYLLELCEQFDLRFLIIADRYAVRPCAYLSLSTAAELEHELTCEAWHAVSKRCSQKYGGHQGTLLCCCQTASCREGRD